MMELGLEGRVALVTAASRGLGRAIAERLAREGARVVISSRDPQRLEAARDGLTAAGGDIVAVPAELGDQQSVERLLDAVRERAGAVDVLVANTGGPPVAPLLDVEPDTWRNAVDDMLIPVVTLARGVVPEMRERRWGRVIVLTSSWVKQPRPLGGLSGGVRGAVSAFTKQLALEVAADEVLVNQVLPGPCWTDRSRQIVARMAADRGITPDEAKALVAAELPIGRYGAPEEVADLVAFLASERASFITGTAIAVDGGQVRSTV